MCLPCIYNIWTHPVLHIICSYLHIVHQTNEQTEPDSIITEEALKQWHLVKSPSSFTFLQSVEICPLNERITYILHTNLS